MIPKKLITTLLALSVAGVPSAALASDGHGNGGRATIVVGGVVNAVTTAGGQATITIQVGSGTVMPLNAHIALPDGFVGHEIVAKLSDSVHVWNAGRGVPISALASGKRVVASIQLSTPMSAAGQMEVSVIGILPGGGAPADPPVAAPAPAPEPSAPAPAPATPAPTETPAPTPAPTTPPPGKPAARPFRLIVDVTALSTQADGGTVVVDITRVPGVSGRLRRLLEGKARLLVDATAVVTGAAGNKIALNDVAVDDGLRVSAELLPKLQWVNDADGTQVPTFRAKRIRDLDA